MKYEFGGVIPEPPKLRPVTPAAVDAHRVVCGHCGARIPASVVVHPYGFTHDCATGEFDWGSVPKPRAPWWRRMLRR